MINSLSGSNLQINGISEWMKCSELLFLQAWCIAGNRTIAGYLSALEAMMDENERNYTNGEITVFWKPKKCVHATTCYRELIEVFNPRKRPWVNMEGATTDRIIEVVDKCPTGALSWEWKDEQKRIEADQKKVPGNASAEPEVQPVWIQVMKDGPIVAQGKFKVYDGNGKELRTWSFTSFCRCGHSMNMPFCDGNHRMKGFRSE